MSSSNCNGYAEDSLEYNPEKIKGSASETEKILRGFPKLPLVVCERLDIKSLLKMPLVLREPTFVAVDQVANFTKKCSVRLKRENLLELKELFMMRNRINNTSYECNICQKVYMSEKKLLNHQENKHVILCYKPDNKIRKKVSFSDEIIVHEVKEYHRCRKCPKIYEDYNSLRVHMKEFHKKRRCYICFYCSKDFIDRMFFKVHIKLHCDSCGLLLPNKKLYIEHRRKTCKTVKKYECKTCHISLFNFLDLKDHSYEHLGQFYICDICKDRFDDKCALTHHIKFLHSKGRPESLYTNHLVGAHRVYFCNFCELRTVERVLMAKHVSTFPEYGKCAMTGYKDFYFCDQCFEKFSTETDMLQHKWTHFLKTTDDIKKELPKPVTLLNMEGSTTNTTRDIKTVKVQNVTELLLDGNAHTPFEILYNADEKLPAFLQPIVLVEKLILPLEKSSPTNFSDVTNLDLKSLKKPFIDRKKTTLSKYQCELCLKYLSTNFCLTRHMIAVHGIRKDNYFGSHYPTKGLLHCNACEEDFALPSLLNNHNCIRAHSTTHLQDSSLDIQFNTSAFSHHNGFDDINTDIDEDYMNSIDFDIPAPIVELTEYENVTLVINGADDLMSNVADSDDINGQSSGILVSDNDGQCSGTLVSGNEGQLYSPQLNYVAVSANINGQLNNVAVSGNHNEQLDNVAVGDNDVLLYSQQLNSVAVSGNINGQLNNDAVGDNDVLLYRPQLNSVAGSGNINGQLDNVAVGGNINGHLDNVAVDDNDVLLYSPQLNSVAVSGNINGQLNNDAVGDNDVLLYSPQLNSVAVSGNINGQLNNVAVGGNINGHLDNVPVDDNDVLLYSPQLNSVAVSGNTNGQLNNVTVGGNNKGLLNNVAVGGSGVQVYSLQLNSVAVSDNINTQSNHIAVSGNTNGQLNNFAVGGNINGHFNNVAVSDNDVLLYSPQLNSVAVSGNINAQSNHIAVSGNTNRQLNNVAVSGNHNGQLIKVAVGGNDTQLYDALLNNVAVGGNDVQCFNEQLKNVVVNDSGKQPFTGQITLDVQTLPPVSAESSRCRDLAQIPTEASVPREDLNKVERQRAGSFDNLP